MTGHGIDSSLLHCALRTLFASSHPRKAQPTYGSQGLARLTAIGPGPTAFFICGQSLNRVVHMLYDAIILLFVILKCDFSHSHHHFASSALLSSERGSWMPIRRPGNILTIPTEVRLAADVEYQRQCTSNLRDHQPHNYLQSMEYSIGSQGLTDFPVSTSIGPRFPGS